MARVLPKKDFAPFVICFVSSWFLLARARLREMLRRVSSVAILVAAVWVTFSPALGFSFLNWDDNLVILDNAALARLGRMEDARRVNAQAAQVAAIQGDRDLSVQITARGRAYR